MEIFKKELKYNRKSLIIWCVCVILLIVTSAMKYEAAYRGNVNISAMIKGMPKMVSVLLGMGQNVDLTTALGFYCLLSGFPIYIGIFYASLLGARVIAREEQDKTSEFLYSRPVTRNAVLSQKLSAAVFYCVIFALTVGIFSYFSFAPVSDGPILIPVVKTTLALLALEIIFVFAGAAFAAKSRKAQKAGIFATAFALYSLFLAKLIDLSGSLSPLRFFTPLKYFDPETILYRGGFHVVYIVLGSLLTVGFAYAVFRGYRNRDLAV